MPCAYSGVCEASLGCIWSCVCVLSLSPPLSLCVFPTSSHLYPFISPCIPISPLSFSAAALPVFPKSKWGAGSAADGCCIPQISINSESDDGGFDNLRFGDLEEEKRSRLGKAKASRAAVVSCTFCKINVLSLVSPHSPGCSQRGGRGGGRGGRRRQGQQAHQGREEEAEEARHHGRGGDKG